MAYRPMRKPALPPHMKAAQRKAQTKKEVGSAVKTASVVGLGAGGGAAALKASDMANPGTVDRVVSKVVEDPYSMSSSVKDVFERVALPSAPVQDIISSAADVGVKTALAAAGATMAYKGIKGIHTALGKQWRR